jgi:YVTN family beta-propeller protein
MIRTSVGPLVFNELIYNDKNDKDAMRRTLIIPLVAIALLLQACAQSGSIFPQLGEQLATPGAFAIDVATNRLYVVNSNSQVLYDWTEGTFQVYDITNPLAPVLVKSQPTPSFSGQIYLDTTRQQAFVPNRFSEGEGTQTDYLFQFDVNEASADFLTYTSGVVDLNPYAIDCCYPADRAWISTSEDQMQYVNLADIAAAPGAIALDTPLDLGGTLSDTGFNHIARKDNQAFLSRENGGIMVVNLDEAGVAGANAVDYFIADFPNPRGLAVRGDFLYAVGEGSECNGDYCRFVMVINVSTMVPLLDNTYTFQVDKEDSGILTATIEIGDFPQEILLSQVYAFVTNQDDDTVSVIDLATNAVAATIPVGVGPDDNDDQPFTLGLYTTLAGVDQYVYVGNVESNTISIIDVPTLTVAATYTGPQ